MKKILLIGDSIREGYDKYVKEALDGIAEVYYPKENCRFAQFVLRSFPEWVDRLNVRDVDIIHWNAGLWDTLRHYDGELLTPPEVYRAFIGRICNKMKIVCPNAKIIFATSTPVVEHRFTKLSYRYNKDVEEYNRIAIEEVSKYGVEINDLYEVCKGLPEDYYSDMTHLYTEKGTEILVNKVCGTLLEALGEDSGKHTLAFTYNGNKVPVGH